MLCWIFKFFINYKFGYLLVRKHNKMLSWKIRKMVFVFTQFYLCLLTTSKIQNFYSSSTYPKDKLKKRRVVKVHGDKCLQFLFADFSELHA